ncbi:MAG: ABC transporter permease [Opitutaceae bacterium]|nr:ABC transporter permease [Opitutaceae bacterium]
MTKAIWTAAVIEPARMVLGLWSRRDLIFQFTHRSIEIRHRGSKLGPFWALLNPLTMLALYFVVFGLIYDQRFGVLPGETRYDYSLALFLGLALFHGFSETLAWGPVVITSNPNFVKKVVFPLEVLPVANVGAAAFHLAVSLGLVVLGSAFGTAGLTWHVLWLPVLIFPLLVLSLGIAWMLAALGVFIRDIGQVTAFAATALLFASAVMYPASMIPANLSILRYNPLLQVVELARHTVLWHAPMPWQNLVYVYACAIVAFALPSKPEQFGSTANRRQFTRMERANWRPFASIRGYRLIRLV